MSKGANEGRILEKEVPGGRWRSLRDKNTHTDEEAHMKGLIKLESKRKRVAER